MANYRKTIGFISTSFLFLASNFIIYSIWMLKFSSKQIKKYKILNYRRNILTMKQNTFLCFIFWFYVSVEQLNNFIIEYMYSSNYAAKVLSC